MRNLSFRQLSEPKTSSQENSHRYGAISLNSLLFFFIPSIVISCLYTYHEAVTKHEQPPFPRTTITNTACHYPQDIVFRLIELTALPFLHFLYLVFFCWISTLIKRSQYPDNPLKWLYFPAQGSVLGLAAAISTIDEAGYGSIHVYGAIYFFLMLYTINTNGTMLLRKLYQWDPSCMDRQSLRVRVTVSLVITAIFLYCLVGLLTSKNEKSNDKYIVILQWSLYFMGLAWFLTFVRDWSRVFITMKGDFYQSVQNRHI